jgi:hypothetical protein
VKRPEAYELTLDSKSSPKPNKNLQKSQFKAKAFFLKSSPNLLVE